MRSRTRWLIGWVCAALAILPTTARAQNLGRPVVEHPLPLMWAERDEGFYFGMEALIMRMNNALDSQVVAVRGLWDETGYIRGSGNQTVDILDGRLTTTPFITTLLANPGTSGQFLGSGAVALTTQDVGGDKFVPGSRFTLGYRLRNGIAFEGNYMSLVAARQTATAGILPPRTGGVGLDLSNSFISAPFFNASPYLAGAVQDVVSNVMLLPTNGGGVVSLVTPGAQNGANQVITDDATIDGLIANRGFFMAAFGIFNGAEIMEQDLRQRFASSELNMRVPIFQGEVTRTYWTGGLRYMGSEERYRLRIVDFDINSNAGPDSWMVYSNKIKNHYYGVQSGLGTEAYLGYGFAFSVDAKVGVAAENSKANVEVERGDGLYSLKHSNNQFQVAPIVQGGAYVWWYPIEGVQLRAGYEFLGIFNARRSPNPIDFDLGRLQPKYENMFMSIDGFTLGVAFIF